MKKNSIEDTWTALFVFLFCIFTLPIFIMICWNAIIPTIFGLTTLTYWQSFALYILSDILFKGE